MLSTLLDGHCRVNTAADEASQMVPVQSSNEETSSQPVEPVSETPAGTPQTGFSEKDSGDVKQESA